MPVLCKETAAFLHSLYVTTDLKHKSSNYETIICITQAQEFETRASTTLCFAVWVGGLFQIFYCFGKQSYVVTAECMDFCGIRAKFKCRDASSAPLGFQIWHFVKHQSQVIYYCYLLQIILFLATVCLMYGLHKSHNSVTKRVFLLHILNAKQ